MSTQHLTTSFIVTEVPEKQLVEVWVDWVPAVDSNPHSPVLARLDGSDLVIEPQGGEDADKRARRVQGLDSGVIKDLAQTHQLVWRLCGPSGVLAEHRLTVTAED